MSFDFWTPVDQSFERSREMRAKNKNASLSYGIPFLDDCLGGILESDVILLSGRSGGGKSEAALQMSMANALNGKVVYHFGLEEAPDEIGFNLGFRIMTQKFYASGFTQQRRPNFLEWMLGRQDDMLGPYEEFAKKELSKLNNLRVVYRGSEFSIADFEKFLISAKSDADLIILDHIHFMDLLGDNEASEHKAMLKKFRSLGIEHKVPIVLVAHIRKQNARAKELMPSMEDIHGSSDIFKICTKAVMLAQAKDQAVKFGEPYRFPTYVQAVKVRHDGSRAHYCGLTAFNAKENAYEKDYLVGKLSIAADEWTEVDKLNLPDWARSK